MEAVISFAIFIVLICIMFCLITLAKNIINETDRIAVLLTVLANKQGCTQEDIDAAIGKSTSKKK